MSRGIIDGTQLVEWLNDWQELDEYAAWDQPTTAVTRYAPPPAIVNPPSTPVDNTVMRHYTRTGRILINGARPSSPVQQQGKRPYLTGTKMLRFHNGRYVSHFDPTIEYRLGVDMVQQSRKYHGGGYYIFLTQDKHTLMRAMDEGVILDNIDAGYYAVAEAVGWGPFNAYDMDGRWFPVKNRNDLRRAKKVSCSVLRITHFHEPFYYNPPRRYTSG